MKEEILLDVRPVPPRERHPRIFRAWESLPLGSSLRLINDHEPKPLYYEFCAERRGEFEWTPVERGPEKWSVQITRVAPPPRAAAVTEDRTVQETIELYPQTLPVFARYGLDACCGGIHPVKVAAAAKGADLAALMADLNDAARPSAPQESAPDWALKTPEHEIDVREDLRRGGEPFQKIMAATSQAGPGEVLLVRAIFEPKPLYLVMKAKGFEHWSVKEGEQDWAVYFRKKGEKR